MWKEDKENATNGKQKGQCSRGDSCSFQQEEEKRAKPTPETAPHSESQTEKGGRSASRKQNVRGRSPSRKFPRQPCRDYLKGICTKTPCDYWHLPECQFYNLNRVVNLVTSARLHTGRLKVNPAKKPRKDGDKSAVRDLGCVRAQKSWDQFDEFNSQSYAASSKHPRKQSSIARSDPNSKSSSAQSVRPKI